MADNEPINHGDGSSRRLFLACWPDQTLQELLDDLARRLHKKNGGRKTARENIHLTLVFLGAGSSASRAAVETGTAYSRCKTI